LTSSFVFSNIPGLFLLLRLLCERRSHANSRRTALARDVPKAAAPQTPLPHSKVRSFVFYNIPGLFRHFSLLSLLGTRWHAKITPPTGRFRASRQEPDSRLLQWAQIVKVFLGNGAPERDSGDFNAPNGEVMPRLNSSPQVADSVVWRAKNSACNSFIERIPANK
jgi:hypothetical protein